MSHQDIGEHLYFFNDVIDGYFPLQISLSHLLERLDTSLAYVEITYAPIMDCLLYTSPSPRDLSTSRMPSSA